MWLMKTLLTSGCTNQRGAGQADGGGLYLLLKPDDGKYWRLKYRVAGKEKLLTLGVYPAVTLADTQAKREEAKRGIAGDIDRMEAKREEN
ncbi:TPA: DUF4102 domain-containing protein [Klebsiella pneumoniae]|nr:DUF4102 domain-containing protein [Klebsiella pneumoniae]HDK7110122.1 DUF4102 domain-containing protein [Klebsiella pneumoniae]